MADVRVAHPWQEELASLVEDTGIPYVGDTMEIPQSAFILPSPELFPVGAEEEEEGAEEAERTKESFKEQVSGFMKAWGEMLLDLGKGCKEIVEQTIVTEDSFIVQKFGKPIAKVSSRFGFLNEYLPEDRDPVHSWSVILSVFMLAFIVIGLSNTNDRSISRVKRVSIHPPTANKVLMPDGRQVAYQVVGVPVDRARFSLIFPHPFLFSRLAGIPGIKTSLLEEFGVCLLTYDLPGFGESDPHPSRNLNSSALDMLHLANAVGIDGKFWVLGYSTGSMHSWAALHYIPDRIAGAAMFSPMINPYDPRLTKDEMRKTWDQWLTRRKFLYFLARKFPSFLSSVYKRSFLSGYHDRLDKWMSLSLGRKDEILIEDPVFEEFWQRNVEESIRQRSPKPFIEEAMLQVSNWGFSLVDIQVQKKCPTNSILSWLKTMYSQAECELVGFLGPIHIWQGLNDLVAPPSMTDYISRILPEAKLHKLPNEGHFSYFFFCDECHRQILTTLFGNPLGPLDPATIPEETVDEEVEQSSSVNGSAIE